MNKVAFKSTLLASCVALTLMAQPARAQNTASPYTTGHRYDLTGHETGTIFPDPDDGGPLHFPAVRNTYDAEYRLIKVESGELASWHSERDDPATQWGDFTIFETISTTYDGLDRKLTYTEAGVDGVTRTMTQYSYDAVGHLQCTAIRMNQSTFGSLLSDACTLGVTGAAGPDRITKNTYDDAGQLIQTRKAFGTPFEEASATYAYSPNGKQTDMVDANGNRAQFVYDGFDRQSQWIFPSTSRPSNFDPSSPSSTLKSAGSVNGNDYEAYSYDSNGNRTSLRKRDGSTITYTYDHLDRLNLKVVSGRSDLESADTQSVYYDYDSQNHQIAARFVDATGEGITNVFDAFGQQTSSTLTMDGGARKASYLYDLDGNRTSVTYPDSNYVTYVYDGLDRPSAIKRSGSAIIAAYTYDAAGRRISFSNSTTPSSATVATNYTYDAVGRLASLSNLLSGNALYNLTISGTGTCRDTANNPAVCYNSANQITEMTKSNSAFAFHDSYNVNRAYNVNGLNQYVNAGSAFFEYDANGNLKGDGSTTFVYDVENRLVGAGGSRNAQLRYDPLGRLYEIMGPNGTTRLFYDGDALIGEYDASGTLLRRYVHGADLKSDDPLAWYEGSGFDGSSERFLRNDWEGSVNLVTDNASNTVYGVNTFDEYGIPGSGNIGRFQYTGQAWLSELGMYYYKARFYSPTIGRFMQTDPIGYKDQINLYAYVNNDPVDGSDPTGEAEELHQQKTNCTGSISCTGTASPGGVIAGGAPQTQMSAGKVAGGIVTGLGFAGTGIAEVASDGADTPLVPAEVEGSIAAGDAAAAGTDAAVAGGEKLLSNLEQAAVHGNSKLSQRMAYFYKLYRNDGAFLKNGITQNLKNRYSQIFMRDKDIIPIAKGPRADMLALERQEAIANPGPLNREPWAGRSKP